MVIFSREPEIKELTKGEQVSGKLSKQYKEEKLSHTVLKADKRVIEEGKLIAEAFNQSIGAFVPSTMFQNLVKNYSVAKQLYGEKMLRMLTGYDSRYIEKNIAIPEFQKELQKQIEKKIEELKDKRLLDYEGRVEQKGIELASLVLYAEEIDHLMSKGMLGIHAKEKSHYGEKAEIKDYKGERYKDIALKASVRKAIKRRHSKIEKEDLKAFSRKSKGTISVIYALDASASMKGEKLETSKKAGIALAFKAIEEKDNVGLVVFGSEVEDFVHPSQDFGFLLQKITQIKASRQTNIPATIQKSVEIFSGSESTKHLILLTDALPTTGKEPEQEALAAVSSAREAGITISLIGIKLDKRGELLAKEITKLGNGRLYVVQDLEELDRIVVQDYYELSR